MTRTDARLNHLANLLVGGTGVAYAWLKYFGGATDPYSQVGHPWQPQAQYLHVLTAPLLVFVAGLIWRTHALKKLSSGHATRRITGIGMISFLFPMTASAYLLQTSVDETWRMIWLWIHLITSFLWIAAYGAHQLGRSIS